jgi:hypothetical protein
MKHLIFLLIFFLIFSGCIDYEKSFVKTISELNTPKKIASYMYNNFRYSYQPYGVKTPMELFILKEGDCNDFSNFSTYVGVFHGYKAWQVRFLKSDINHWISVFEVSGEFIIIDNRYYDITKYNSIDDIVNFYSLFYEDFLGYEIYDYQLNLLTSSYI